MIWRHKEWLRWDVLFQWRSITDVTSRSKAVNGFFFQGIYTMHNLNWCPSRFNTQQLYILPTLHLCALFLSENKQRFLPYITSLDWFL